MPGNVSGVSLAFVVGLLDGAMLVPLKCFRKAMEHVHDSYDVAYVFIFLVCIFLISAGKAFDLVVERISLAYLSLLNGRPSSRPVTHGAVF